MTIPNSGQRHRAGVFRTGETIVVDGGLTLT